MCILNRQTRDERMRILNKKKIYVRILLEKSRKTLDFHFFFLFIINEMYGNDINQRHIMQTVYVPAMFRPTASRDKLGLLFIILCIISISFPLVCEILQVKRWIFL